MKELAVAVNERPENADTAQQQAWPAKQVAEQRASKGQILAALHDEPDAPGFHGQRLPAVTPEPDEVDEQRQKNLHPQK